MPHTAPFCPGEMANLESREHPLQASGRDKMETFSPLQGDKKVLRRKRDFYIDPYIDPATPSPESQASPEIKTGQWESDLSTPNTNRESELVTPLTDWSGNQKRSSSIYSLSPKIIPDSSGVVLSSPTQHNTRASRASYPSAIPREPPLTRSALDNSRLALKKLPRGSYPSRTEERKSTGVHFQVGTTDTSATQSATMLPSTERRRVTPDADMARSRATPTPSWADRLPQRSQSQTHQRQQSDISHSYSHSRNSSVSSSRIPLMNGGRSSEERGRNFSRRYELQLSDSEDALSPVQESARDARHSHITTMTELLEKGMRESPTRGSRSMSRHKSPPKPASRTPADQREKRRPMPLDLSDARRYGEMVGRHTNVQPIHYPMTPEEIEQRRVNEDNTSSNYTNSTPLDGPPTVSPLRIPRKQDMKRVNILHVWRDWEDSVTPGGVAAGANALARSPSRMEPHPSPNDGSQVDNVAASSTDGSPFKRTRGIPKSATTNDVRGTAPFTPLTPWLMNGEKTRIASKTLISDKGWLEDTAARSAKKPEAQKNTGFFRNIKKKAREIADMADLKNNTRSTFFQPERLNISLGAREQSLLYCELEYTLSNALNAYIKAQFECGRLDVNKLWKIADAWAQKGRPKVVGFRYDLETQLDLIVVHIDSFRFYGARQTDQVAVRGLLHGMRVNARAMRVRTFCHPDPVIAKQILDAQTLFQLLDSPYTLQLALAEVSQFFKVVVEREKAARFRAEMGVDPHDAAPNTGRPRPNPSPPKSKFPGEYRIKNEINTPAPERKLSGPILEPKTYDPNGSGSTDSY
ncbi:hypothetical protein F5B20DRAFT_584174 [Whalleya microplaca]|nr:hypothetical protein F5B20DRAFT_584174 [Whalleya microplaca]